MPVSHEFQPTILPNLAAASVRAKAVRFLENIKKEIVVSVQVVNELSNVLIRHGIEEDKIRRAVREIAAICLDARMTMVMSNRAW